MKHRIGFNRLDRRQAHRKALKNNMVTSLFRYERIETTKAKALEVRRAAEKMVTRAREDSVHNRRIVAKRIHDQEILAKLFTEIAPRYLERPGGYTRVIKTGRRQGDAAEMVILELVDRVIEEKVRPEREPAKEPAKEPEEPQAEPAAEPAEKEEAPEPEPSAETAEDEGAPEAEPAPEPEGKAGAEAAVEPEETKVEEAAPSPEKKPSASKRATKSETSSDKSATTSSKQASKPKKAATPKRTTKSASPGAAAKTQEADTKPQSTPEESE